MAEAAVGAGVGMAGAGIAARSTMAAATYNKIVGDANAEMAELQAEMQIKRGNEEARNFKKQVKKTVGSQRAALAAQGVDVTDGSALDVQIETEILGAEDAMTIKNNAFLEAMGMRAQAQNIRAQGKFDMMAAENQTRNSIISAGLNGYVASGAAVGSKVKNF